MYKIYKINVEYSRRDYRGRDYTPDFMDVLNAQKDIQTPIYKKSDIKWLR